MENVLLIEVSALPVLLTLIVSTVSRKLYKGKANILLFWIIVLAFCSSFADTVANFFVPPLSYTKYLIVLWVNYFYFITRNGLNCAYIFYIIAVTRTWYKIRQWWKKALLIAPYAGIVIMMMINPFTDAAFTVTMEQSYQRGDLIIVVYLLAASYLIIGSAYLIVHRKLLALSEWMSLFALYLFNVVGIVLQLIFPYLLVECYFTSITLLFVALFVQKPEKQVDMNTGLPGYFAFKDAMAKTEMSGQRIQVVIACINNADEFVRYLSDEVYNAFVHDVEGAVMAYARKERLSAELYFELPGYFYIILSDTSYNPVQGIQEIRDMVSKKNGAVSDAGLQVDLKIVSVRFPEEIGNSADLVHFAHNFTRFTGDRLLYHTEQIAGEREYRIETRFDEILKRAVNEGRFQVCFSPVWSTAEKKPVYAEAIVQVDDPDFGIIDEDMLRRAALARGAAVLFGENALEQIFARLKQENLSQAGLSYVIVKLPEALGMQKTFTDMVWNLRGKYEIYPEQICFAVQGAGREEIGEAFRENIQQLVRLGYRVAIDDYGNGMVNTEFLSAFKISCVRLDRSMLKRGMNAAGRSILGGTITMLQSIPVEVVVSGVDDNDTMRMLTNMGCELMQGKLFERGTDKDGEEER